LEAGKEFENFEEIKNVENFKKNSKFFQISKLNSI